MFEASHKTVILLDHTAVMKESSGVSVELDTSGGPGGNGGPSSRRTSQHGHSAMNYFGFIPPVAKTLWTYGIESTLEYARIVWDIFSEERLLLFLFADSSRTRQINTWQKDKQNLTFVCDAFIDEGTATKSRQGNSIQLGIKAALQALSTPSEAQDEFMTEAKSSLSVVNKGRVICLTSCTTDVDLLACFLTTLTQHNASVSPSDHLLPIHECEFILLSIHPVGKERLARVVPFPPRELSPNLTVEICILSADSLYDKMVELCTRHHNLVITTVTNIPMKEEQNATSSSNYDVPLFHPKMSTTCPETQLLKWSTPSNPRQSTGGALHPCNSACRITPVDVNSRPSTCLSNFVISGRSVWLETPKKGKSTSHVLMSHGGEIWMHVMETARNILEDPPSISEGIGGRVTDYRIPDFVELMRLNMLIPYPEKTGTGKVFDLSKDRRLSQDEEKKDLAIESSKARLVRKTVYWPLTISGSLLFPMAVHLEDLLRLMPRDSLDEMEKVCCDKTLWSLMAIEARNEAPPIPAPHHKKGHKRDEQWRSVYNEVENFLRANLHSEAHQKVLECFMESRQNDSKSFTKLDKEKGNDIVDSKSMKTVIADSPASPTPMTTTMIQGGSDDMDTSSQPNLLALWRLKTEKKDLRALPPTFKLYAHLDGMEITSISAKSSK